MKTKSRRALVQMTSVLALAVAAAVLICLLKMDLVKAIFFSDVRTVLLNGIILLLFILGLGRLYQGLIHYAAEERHIARFVRLKEEGVETEAALEARRSPSIVATRYATIKELFDRGVPINHGAVTSIMVAEESLYQSFPRFVNNVLILTGVFGTISSLIFALLGASNVLRTALPGEGMGVMLLGMNTALTTTATAIVCYFFFTYFYQKLTDAQTYLFSQVEKAVLLYIIPDFAFETDAINHQTKLLLNDVRDLVRETRAGVGGIEASLAGLNVHNQSQIQMWDRLVARQDDQKERLAELLARLEEVRRVLIEGFRLRT